MESKLWGGRFSAGAHESLSQLNNSLPIDKRLYDEDITGSVAYAKALFRAQLITALESKKIVEGLETVRVEWQDNTIQFLPSDEDVHTVNERRLTELIGREVGGKLHMGRSRNDQVATDMRLWMKRAIDDILKEFKALIVEVICPKAEQWIDVLVPGYTHLQRAQVIRISHWLLSYAFYFESDIRRFVNLLERVDVLPLGSGAIAGNPFPIDRKELAEELGFKCVTRNSMLGVGDRDFVTEFLFATSLTSQHMSRFAEDLILYSSKEFGFLQISDTFSTGSSLMPQKRNPDSLELIRGISGEIFGQLAGFMMTMKGIPSTYNKDMQSDKKAMFEAFDRLQSSTSVLKGVLSTMQVNTQNCQSALTMDMLATDIAYYLVRKGLPFRTAHHVAGQVIKLSETENLPLDEIPLVMMEKIHPLFTADVKGVWSFAESVEQYQVSGGTSKSSVQEQIVYLRDSFQ